MTHANRCKGSVAIGNLKERESPNVTAQHMIGEVSRSEAWAAWDGGLLPKLSRSREEKDSRPLFLSAAANDTR